MRKTEATNPREFWNAYQPFLHSKTTRQANDIVLKEYDEIITDKKLIADLFKNHFVHVADGVSHVHENDYGENFVYHPSIKAIHESNSKSDMSCLFTFQHTNRVQIEKLLLEINARKSSGHDMIPPRLIKESATAIAEPLAKIVNASIDSSCYPVRWKKGQVTLPYTY